MNFKKEYQEAFSDIKADEDFKKQLAKKLNEAERPGWKTSYTGMIAAAAVLIVVVSVGIATGVLVTNSSQEQSDVHGGMVQNDSSDITDGQDVSEVLPTTPGVAAGTNNSETYMEMNFSDLSWYGKAENDEALLDTFISLVGGETLDTLYCGADNGDDGAVVLSDAEVDALIASFDGAAAEDVAAEGDGKYYRAVFESGMNIRFVVYENGYLQLEDTGSMYKLK